MIFAQSILDAMTQSLFNLTLQYSLPFLIDLVSQLNINYIAKVRDLKFLFWQHSHEEFNMKVLFKRSQSVF